MTHSPRPFDDAFDEIDGRLKQKGPLVLGLDFDGTLTPLRDRPDEVQLDGPTRSILERLARNPRVRVLIVSGRSIADLAARIALPNVVFAGNHGLEIQGNELSFIEPTASASSQRLGELADELRQRLADVPGALVEPKGLTLGIHYRNVPLNDWDRLTRTVRAVAEREADRFLLRSGKLVWEIRPAVVWHKGRAILWAMDRLNLSDPLIFYFGDDLTDEDAFASLASSGAYTVKVGDFQSPTLARYLAADPAAVRDFLVRLDDRLTRFS